MNRKIEAAKVLYRYGSVAEAQQLLQAIWEAPDSESQSFECFLAMMELWISKDVQGAQMHLEGLVSGYGPLDTYWEKLSPSEKAIVFDWLGQLQWKLGAKDNAFESFSRAASLGRDTSLLWRLLGDFSIDREDLDMSLRYLKRSLQLYRQLDLEVLSGRSHVMGAFSGQDPLKWTHSVDDYMHLLLRVTRAAKGSRNLKLARELLIEMLHQFPLEPRLPKLRLMIERSIVEHSLFSPQPRKTLEMR
jgi:tetratricopeptide (TPR) repeat protein